MKIHYRIISVDHKDHSMIVRYYTDLLTEEMLAIDDQKTKEGYPVRCRTDYNITFWKHPATIEDIETQIKSSAPIQWFMVKEHTHQNETALSHVEHLVGKANSFEHIPYVPPEHVPYSPSQTFLEKELTSEEIENLLKSL